MLATPCFTRDELQRYLLGHADDALSAAIEDHLDRCARCDDTLTEIDASDDTLVRTLQVKSGGHNRDTPAWVAQLANQPFPSPPPSGSQPEPEPPAELGDYELVSVLGRGGMSVVFAARHKHLGRVVALKVLLPTNQQRSLSRERFAREMRAVGVLDHAAIIRATDAGECNETLYLVMERIDGVDLNRVSKAEGPLRVADACAIGLEVAQGLAHAHQQGVVHRDVKPSNLMLDHNGRVKILDFGLARIQSAACDVSLQTTIGQLLGTLDYMAPEQANGVDIDARADIYALGATLYKLLVGTPPHGRSAEMPVIEFLHRLATHDAPRLDQQRDHIPDDLVELIAAMLERDPARRISSVDEIATRLAPLAAGSQLPELAARAAAKLSEPDDDAIASIKSSLTALWPSPAEPPPPSPPKPDVARGRGGMGSWLALVTIGVALLGFGAFAIILTLKSPEGEIRIESELENVRVEVVDERDRVDVITVEHGTAITTVSAGRYRIRLDSPSDGIEVRPREIVVTKDKIAIAKVTKVSSAKPDADAATATGAADATGAAGAVATERHPTVAITAQVQLAQTINALAAAKQQAKPDPEAIKSLEEQLARLQALSRPIPTEPVYKGRTLADWVAQMRFEQETTAKKVAAANVLKLAATRPADERIGLYFEAGTRLYGWDTRRLEQRMYEEFSEGRYDIVGSSALKIAAADRNLAARQLVRALQSADPDHRDYALTLCADLRDLLRQEAWPGVLAALQTRSQQDQEAARVLAQLTLASCLADPSEAADVLLSIDLDHVSTTDITSMFYVAEERNLVIPRGRAVAWLATYLELLDSPLDLYDRLPREFSNLWIQPALGPFRNADWNRVDAALQADVNAALMPLLKSLQTALDGVAEDPHDVDQQATAAMKSNILTRLIVELNLTGDAQCEAVRLLNLRLDQLIDYRATRREPPPEQTDTPARIAVAIMLLTGKVPASITQLSSGETGCLAEPLEANRKVLATLTDYRSQQLATVNVMHGGRSYEISLSEWYPYEILTAIYEADQRLKAALHDRSSGSRRSSNLRDGWLLRMAQSNALWKIDLRLLLHFATTSEDAATYVNANLTPEKIANELLRYPQFLQAVSDLMEKGDNLEAVTLGYRLIHAGQEDKPTLLRWLKSGDAIQSRFALAQLAASGDKSLYLEWATLAADAIDRIAKKHQLTLLELRLLSALGNSAPQAAIRASDYLRFWLNHRQQRLGGEVSARQDPSLKECTDILRGSPEQSEKLLNELEKFLENPADPESPLSKSSITDVVSVRELLINRPN